MTILAHPTGRPIGEREPYALDLDGVLRTAKRLGKAVEINAYPERLDLDDVGARRATELGVPIAISTDAHVLDDLACMELGVATARRGWVPPEHVVNTWPARRLVGWIETGRSASRRTTTA